jgi:hypothetical protein
VLRSIDARWAEVLRPPLLVVGIWGVLWMLGQLAAYKVRPHLVTADHLRIRSGSRSWVVVPLTSIADAQAAGHGYPGVVKSLHHEDDLLLVGVSLRTNLELVLDRPGPSTSTPRRAPGPPNESGSGWMTRAPARRNEEEGRPRRLTPPRATRSLDLVWAAGQSGAGTPHGGPLPWRGA